MREKSSSDCVTVPISGRVAAEGMHAQTHTEDLFEERPDDSIAALHVSALPLTHTQNKAAALASGSREKEDQDTRDY